MPTTFEKAPPDEVETKLLFEWENVVLLEHRKPGKNGDGQDGMEGSDENAAVEAEWVDIGRGTLRAWHRLVKGFNPDLEFDPSSGVFVHRCCYSCMYAIWRVHI